MSLALNPSSYSTLLTVSRGRAAIPLGIWRSRLSNPGAFSKVQPSCSHSLIHKTHLKQTETEFTEVEFNPHPLNKNLLKFTRQS